jgi:hypothetical protein
MPQQKAEGVWQMQKQAFVLRDLLLENRGQAAEEVELQRLASFRISTRSWINGIVKEFELDQESVVSVEVFPPKMVKPRRCPKGMEPLFYIEGSGVEKIEFDHYMDVNSIKKAVPSAQMAFFLKHKRAKCCTRRVWSRHNSGNLWHSEIGYRRVTLVLFYCNLATRSYFVKF